MTLICYKDQGFTAVSVLTKRTNGTVVTPDADPICDIFRVDPTTGQMTKDLDMGSLGQVTLSLVAGSAFLYSAAVDLAPANFETYELVISYSYDGSTGTNVDRITMIVSRPDTIVYRGRNVTVGSQGTTYKAPSSSGN